MPSIRFDNTYARLPDRFFTRTNPTPVAAPKLIRVNVELAAELGIDAGWLSGPEGTAVLAGNALPEGAEPIAVAYAGHQFGGFVPQLGDGRAILLGEVVDREGRRQDLQLKGPGRTPFSRMGDGRAAMGPVLREYLVSEWMAAVGVPTTRALAAVATGEMVHREEPLPGAILTRVAASHIRVGTFEFFASRDDVDGVRVLADHSIARHYPEAAGAERPYRAFLDAAIVAQAELIARWLNIGFIHGVMNTDNMAVSGETIDFGPCAFLDEYDPAKVYSAIDRHGRYAFGNQPAIAQWNLTRLAECLLPLLAEDQEAAVEDAKDALGNFAPAFQRAYVNGLRRKLGLRQPEADDAELARDLLSAMHENGADFTLTFRRLADAAVSEDADAAVRSLFADPSAFDAWVPRWRARLAAEGSLAAETRESMRSVNPAFIPRNHRIEAVIRAAVDREDFGAFENLHAVLSRPFEDQPGREDFMDPPQPHERVLRTFCGT